MIVSSEIWGHYYWFFLHTISLHYPNSPNDSIKKKYYDLINNFYLFIPDSKIGDQFVELINKYPISPFLDSRKSFVHWVHFIHNKINENVGKPKIPLSLFYSNYYELTKPKQEKDILYKKWSNKLIFLAFLIILIIISIYLYRK
jgi:hypothetical protein